MIRTLSLLLLAGRGERRPCERIRIAGLDTVAAFPAGGAGPVVVCVNAATPHGIEQPAVRRFVSSLAGAGFVAVAPELPGVRERQVTPATVNSLVQVSRAAGERVALIGASTGAGLAILAAADSRLAERVTAVAAIAPFASLRSILKLATTGHYGDHPFDASPVLGEAATRSLVASAPLDPAVPTVVANRDPDRFDELYASLAPATRDILERLSPRSRIDAVRAGIEIAAGPGDRFVPVAEAYALADARPDARLTVTSALDHVSPRLRPGVMRVAGLLERTLRGASDAGPSSTIDPAA